MTTATTAAVLACADRLRVVAVPSGHDYPRHLLPLDPGTTGIVLSPDPDPDDPSRPAGERWWPPVALEPAWLAEQVDDDACDVLHLHFGFDDAEPARLARLLDVAAEGGTPTVLTVHDLRSPHQHDPARLDAQLDVLVPRVDAVLTLTRSAAAEVASRWGRPAQVVAHPHVVDLDTAARLRAARRRGAQPADGDQPADGARVVGLAVKGLRRNVDPLRLLPGLQEAVLAHPDAVLRVTAHHELRARTDAEARTVVAGLDAAAEHPRTQVVWHDRLDDRALAEELARLHVAVLPYRFGTHSGWLEACHDVGTRVLAPSLGCYADQGADGVYAADEHAVDTTSLVRELARLLAEDPTDLVGLEPAERAAQREALAATHLQLYRSLVGAGEAR